jgi:hypothetical protein
VRPVREALPDGISVFTAIHVEKATSICQKVVKFVGGGSPEEQAKLVTQEFGCLMDISESRNIDDQNPNPVQQSLL